MSNLPDLKIKRAYYDSCTLGRLTLNDFHAFTLELPWLENQKNISCIPAGVYKAVKYNSPKFKRTVIMLYDVYCRDNIEIHAGNYTRQTKGCILIGDGIKYLDLDAIPDVTNSNRTLDALLSLLPNEFNILIN